jgi:hypothetical protein
MPKRRRYKLDRVEVFPTDSRPASWTFAGPDGRTAVRGTEYGYAVTDTNFSSRNRWEFLVRVPDERNSRVEIRPRTVPDVAAWAELPDRSLTFAPATRGPARGRWYCLVALADPAGRKSRTVVKAAHRAELPYWFREVASRIRRKETVKPTRSTDGDALVVLVPAGDHAAMVRLFFATKVWILSEGVVL